MRRTTIPVLLMALALAAGCSSDGDDPGTTTSPDSPTTSASEPDSPSTSSSPDDEATGIRLSLPNSTVRAPQDWSHSEDLTRYEDGANSADNLSFVMLGEINAFGSDASADELAQNRIKANLYPKAPRVLPVSELDGTEAYHVAGFVTPQQYVEEFGTIVRDRIVTLTFSFNNKVPKSERDEVVASVLPTFQWK